MDELIVLKDLTKIYKMGDEKIVALDNINLNIYKEEFICLLGTSGSGKSTLLNMMAGLEKPTKGEIIIGKHHIESMSEKNVTKFRQLNVGFIFQSYNLISTLTAMENVSLGLTFKGIPRSKRNKMAKEMLTNVGLGDRLYHKPSELSGGQQQRVSIARAFVGNPKIIFADEPTGNLDTKTTIEVMNLMTTMAKESDQTLIVVTHDTELTDYVDKVVYLRDGHIENIEEKNVTNKGETVQS